MSAGQPLHHMGMNIRWFCISSISTVATGAAKGSAATPKGGKGGEGDISPRSAKGHAPAQVPRLLMTGDASPLIDLELTVNLVLGSVPHSALLPGCSVSVFSAGRVPLLPHVLGNWPAHQQREAMRCVSE